MRRARTGLQVAQWALLVLGLVLLATGSLFVGSVWLRLGELDRRVALLRAASPGRTEDEVVAWLGPPRFIHVGDGAPLPKGYRLLTWPSGSRNPLIGLEDVKVLVNPEGRVDRVYYTDSQQDRRFAPDLP
jgi:hypothetical protein